MKCSCIWEVTGTVLDSVLSHTGTMPTSSELSLGSGSQSVSLYFTSVRGDLERAVFKFGIVFVAGTA